jgi:hypothetical protein
MDAKGPVLAIFPISSIHSWRSEVNRFFLLQMDKFCLQHEKRCIMWDDEGNGFYLVCGIVLINNT